jgi:hypothetical protein
MAALGQAEAYSRTRLLNRLGMFQEKRMTSSYEISPIVPPKGDYDTGTVLGIITPIQEELKDHSEQSSLPPPCQEIRFNPSASVVYIPSRNQYSNIIKKRIWTDRYELAEMVERNTLEFEYEGYDFNKVVLEEDMCVDSLNGELVHPCNVFHASNQQYAGMEEDKEEDLDDFGPLKKEDSFDFFGMFRETFEERMDSLRTGM